MPSTATITSFYSFTANTKARASQVQNNFDMMRGHLIPIHPNTQTAISNTYDLGSSEWRWRAVYLPATTGTLAAAVGGWAIGPVLSVDFTTSTSMNISGSTLTISTHGRPVEYGFIPNSTATDGGAFNIGTTSTSDVNYNITLMRDGVTASSIIINAASSSAGIRYLSPSAVKFLDTPAAGTYVYSIKANIVAGTARFATIVRMSTYAKEF